MSIHRRLCAAVAAVAAAVAMTPVAAHADVTDVTAAELTNSLDQADAATVSATADPNITCDVKAAGRDVVQHTNYVVGEVYGQDLGSATGECASLDTARLYTSRLEVQIEYFTSTGLASGYWLPVPGCSGTSYGDSVQGVAVPPPPLVFCGYSSTSGYLNRYHRAHATLVPGVPGASVRHAYSPTWFMAP